MSVYISGVGIVSSLGKNYEEHKENLFELKEGFPEILMKIMDLF